MKRKYRGRSVALFICLLLLLSSLPSSVLATSNEEGDSIQILSVTPDNLEPGSVVDFTVTVEYTLKSDDAGWIMLAMDGVMRFYDHTFEVWMSEEDFPSSSSLVIAMIQVDEGSGVVALRGTAAFSVKPTELEVGFIKNLESADISAELWDIWYFTADTEEYIFPKAIQYVPYHVPIPTAQKNSSFTLTSGSLPEGLSLSAGGVLSGIPAELGVFNFKVMETYADGRTFYQCTLSVYSRMYADVESYNVPGYGFVETETDDGRVQDQVVTSAAELTDQVMHCEGPYSQFRNLYLDARKLIRDVEYTAEEGSTKITIYAETIGEEGGGTHTLAAEFETDDGETVYTVQNYTVTGIASREVHVTVYGETVIWTDAEPYIDSNSRTMTPFRVVGDALGLTIAWDSETREASFSRGNRTIFFPIGSPSARTSEGKTVEMDTSAVIVNGRTYAPIRYLAQYFGYSVDWDSKTRTVSVSYKTGRPWVNVTK